MGLIKGAKLILMGLVPLSQAMPEGVDLALIGLAQSHSTNGFLRSLTLAQGRVGTRQAAGSRGRLGS